jgi:hypothetical protein
MPTEASGSDSTDWAGRTQLNGSSSNRAKRPAQTTYCQPCLCCAVQLTQNTTRRPVGLPPSSTLLPTPATTPPVHHHHSSVRLPRNGSRAQGRAGHRHPDDPQPRLPGDVAALPPHHRAGWRPQQDHQAASVICVVWEML